DIDMGVNWVIRGADHLANTPRHLMISWALHTGCKNMFNNDIAFPMHTHVGLIMLDGKKMSKRDETSPLKYYIDADYNRDAILNFILRLG
ncbi:glutamate--tRNA ligase family protein, partial [Streptomyces galilaeus]|uniref:glutamate--tRNA ligase family protein n=1 Tax=Streptomyces galilaeus TaxID=33899 RepID=UPI0038F6297C